MACRSELQGIANALNENFVSRNNDVNGYWAMGQLNSLATDTRTTSMHFYLTHLEKKRIAHYITILYAATLNCWRAC